MTLALSTIAAAPAIAASTQAPACALDDPLYSITASSPEHRQLLTPWKSEADSAVAKYGFAATTIDWQVSTAPATGLVAIHRLYNPTRADFYFTGSATEIATAIKSGYQDQGISFYAATTPAGCANALVYVGHNPKTGIRHYSTTQRTLMDSGYTTIAPAFYVHSASAAASSAKPAAILGKPYVQRDTAAWAAAKNPAYTAAQRRNAYNLAATSSGIWLGGYASDGQAVQRITTEGQQTGTVPQFVLYAIPGRDCGSFSAGGVASDAKYRAWVDSVSAGIGNRLAVIIVEPDAISFCNNATTRASWSALMTYAAKTISTNNPNAVMYIHAGSGRPEPTVNDMAQRLVDSGIVYMRGFAMNVASLGTNAEEMAYGDQLVARLAALGYPNKHYVIDTSRNGVGRAPNPGAAYNSCNNFNAAIGHRPTTQVSNPLVDALLWVKRPGESDGLCHTTGLQIPSGSWHQQLADSQIANALKVGTITYLPLPASF